MRPPLACVPSPRRLLDRYELLDGFAVAIWSHPTDFTLLVSMNLPVRSAISEEEISMTEDSAMEATTNEDDDDSSDGSVVHSFVNAANLRNMRKNIQQL